MSKLLLFITSLVTSLALITSCTKDNGEFLFNNPMDEQGTNWHEPYLTKQHITLNTSEKRYINDTIPVSVQFDLSQISGEENHPDSLFAWVGSNNTKLAAAFSNGATTLNAAQDSAGDFPLRVWMRDKSGRLSDTFDLSYTVDWGLPTINSIPTLTTSINDQKMVGVIANDVNGAVEWFAYSIDGQTFDTTNENPFAVEYPKELYPEGSTNFNQAHLWVHAIDDDNLSSDTLKVNVTVTAYKPYVIKFPDAISPLNQQVRISVHANDSDGTVQKFRWAVEAPGGEQSAPFETEEPFFDTTFTELGNYMVSVTLIDDDSLESRFFVSGASQTDAEALIEVKDGAPTVTAAIDTTVGIGTEVTLWAEATSSISNIEDMLWSFDGGESWIMREAAASATNASVQRSTIAHRFETPGTAVVWVKAITTGAADTSTAYSFEVRVTSVKPVVKINKTEDPLIILRTKPQRFETTIAAVSGAIVRYRWFIGGKLIQEGEHRSSIEHTFDASGNYVLSVEVEDEFGEVSDRATLGIKVLAGAPTITDWTKELDNVVPNASFSIEVREARDTLGTVNAIRYLCLNPMNNADTLVDEVRPYQQLKVVKSLLEWSFPAQGSFQFQLYAIDNGGNQSEAPRICAVTVRQKLVK